MTPDRPPPRMRPRSPFEDRCWLEPREPPGAATRSIPDLNRGQQPSKRPHPAAPPRCPPYRTYLSPVQSHPHSIVLSYSTAKPQLQHPLATQQEQNLYQRSAISYIEPHLIPIHRHAQTRPPQQFNCQIRTQFSLTS